MENKANTPDTARIAELEAKLEALKQERDQALKASQMKSEFLANMSHEIRTPLNGIVGTTELLSEMAQDREQLELLNTLKLSSETLLHIINDILDFSKIEQGKLSLENRDFYIQEVCDSVLQLFKSTAKDKGLELVAIYEPSPLPPLKGDPTRLRQILSNLVSNALKFTHDGHVEVRITVAENAERGVEIQVNDTGIGIEQDKQQLLFDAFTQGDSSTTRKYGGSGLGLAICSQLTKLMNGYIMVNSEVGKGTQFTLHLPLTINREEGQKGAAGVDHNFELDEHLWVLLVDDNLINRKVGTRLVESMHCSVMLAENAKEAIAACAENNFDLVLMDIQMPEMDGVEAMHAIHQLDKPTPPIVALTAHALQGDRQRYMQEGFDDYIEKPLKKARLWEVLTGICEALPKNLNGNEALVAQLRHPIVLNLSTHKEFVEMMGDEYPALVARYRRDLLDGCEKIITLVDNDLAEAQQIAHRLKSSAGYLGAERMHNILQWLETEAEKTTVDQRLTTAKIASEIAHATCEALTHKD